MTKLFAAFIVNVLFTGRPYIRAVAGCSLYTSRHLLETLKRWPKLGFLGGVKEAVYCANPQREEPLVPLLARAQHQTALEKALDTRQVGTIVWHVAAHEIGHAIYGLGAVKDAIKVSTKTLLEEPRAELTALHTMRLLLPAGLLTQVHLSAPRYYFY